MAAGDRNGEVITQGECTDYNTREHSFDELARGLASETVSRRKVLRLLGGALVGGAVASIPGLSWLSGESGEAQAAVCATRGRACNRRRCCSGLACIGKPGNRVCCPKRLVCGSVCCLVGVPCPCQL